MSDVDDRVVADRDRIARDLHDHVVQRLYAAGLDLRGTCRRCAEPEVRQRIRHAVDQLDETVREIRTAIFRLHGPRDEHGLRQRVLDTVTEVVLAAGDEGPSPSVRFLGAVDTVVGDELAGHAAAVVREAVTNVVRHAAATQVVVTVDARDGLVIEVSDDGRGIAPDREAGGGRPGNGLRNLSERARVCGGSCAVLPRRTGGTLVRWAAPLARM